MRKTHFAAALAAALVATPASAAFNFDHLWTFNHTTAAGSKVGGIAEIVAFDQVNNNLWVVGAGSTQTGIDILNLSGGLVNAIDTTSAGGINSVAINQSGLAAVSITAPNKVNNGLVRFFNTSTFASITDVTVGANPDAVTFTPDGSRVLVANEGEPNSYGQASSVDPIGSVGIINTSNSYSYAEAGFGSFNATTLKAEGVRLNGPGATVSQDLEPEYIAVSDDGTTAFATLQEANSVAIVDIASATVTDIVSLGTKDHSLANNGYTIDGQPLGNGIDASDRDGTGNNPLNGNIQLWKVKGLYMPDGIASFTQGGNQFYVTANEGDGRDYTGFVDEVRVGSLSIDPALDTALDTAHGTDWQSNNDKLNRLTATQTGNTDNDSDQDEIQVFGARSFSILDDNGNIVFDSGDFLEQIIKSDFSNLWDDSRSDNKGPEPESAVVKTIGGRQLLFLGLERSNAIAIFDLTSLSNITFVNMIFTAGDVGPEGLSVFTSSTGQSYLAVANETSGTTSLYSVTPVPVPAAAWLFASSLAGLGFRRRKV